MRWTRRPQVAKESRQRECVSEGATYRIEKVKMVVAILSRAVELVKEQSRESEEVVKVLVEESWRWFRDSWPKAARAIERDRER